MKLPRSTHLDPLIALEVDPRRPLTALDKPTRLTWFGLVASLIAVTILLRAARLAIDPFSSGNIPYLVCGVIALGLRMFAANFPWRCGRAVGNAAEYYAIFVMIALLGAIASYPIAALTNGFHDAMLQRADEAIGFDWLAWYRTVADHVWLQTLGLLVYRSIYLTPAVLLGHAAWTGDRRAAVQFLAIFWLTAVATLVIYAFIPAIGPLSYLWHGPLPYLPDSEVWQQGLIPALRDHNVRLIDLAHLRGLVSAPSFHAAAAVIYICAAWPIRRLRWPIFALNLAMLLSTPVEGTHYLADILIGMAVAGIVIWAIRIGGSIRRTIIFCSTRSIRQISTLSSRSTP